MRSGIQNRLVLELARDQLAPSWLVVEETLERQVVRLRRARRPHNLTRLRANQISNLRASLLDQILCRQSHSVRCRRRVSKDAVGTEAAEHGLHDTRVRWSGCSVVEVPQSVRPHCPIILKIDKTCYDEPAENYF